MPTTYDLGYRTLLALGAPLMLARPAMRAKLARARRERNGEVPPRQGRGRCVLLHAVSVGEVNATRELILQLLGPWEGQRPRGPSEQPGREQAGGPQKNLQHPTSNIEHRSAAEEDGALHIVVSVTTDTGFERASRLFCAAPFGGRVSIVRFPLDLSAYVRRFLDRLRPDVAVLMELEVWPNFVLECSRRGIAVVLVNGRLTERSYKRYRLVGPLVRPMYSRLSAVCAQEGAYAKRFIGLGVPAERVSVTGTMKFDSAQVGERVEGDEELARALGLRPRALGGDEPIIVCGSTGPGEEQLIIEAFARLVSAASPDGTILPPPHREPRLAIIPRKPERFDEVASLMGLAWSVVRRSSLTADQRDHPEKSGPTDPLILGDTMGELRKFYSLADVVVVGRTLLDLGEKQHGSDMIEPAALGKPVVVGPFTGNFAEPMRALLAADAIRQIGTASPEAPAGQSGGPPRRSPKWAPPAGRASPMVDALVEVLDSWLRNPAEAAAVGRRARELVLANRGATARHVAVILQHLRERES